MILHLGPETPAALRAAAQLALVLHISGAATALVAGPAAMLLPKGSRPHRLAGHLFFVSMLAMSGVGAVVAPFLPDPISALAGGLAFYLTATGWAAVVRGEGRIGRFEPGALLFAVGLATAAVLLGREAQLAPGGRLDGAPFLAGYVFAALAALAAASDLRVIVRGGASGVDRIARHLWRMGLALLLAAVSFAGQPKAQPEGLRGSPLMILPAVLILAGLLYWFARVRLERPRPYAPRGRLQAAR